MYIDGDDSTVIHSKNIPTDTDGSDIYSYKPSVRGKSFKIEILGHADDEIELEIRRLECEFE